MDGRISLGRQGEDLAASYLERAGFTIITRNWRCQRGEIDIIARDGDTTAFVEVKTRSSLGSGHPFEAITPRKVARLSFLAAEWCRQFKPASSHLRIDAVAVLLPRVGPAVVDHLQGITR